MMNCHCYTIDSIDYAGIGNAPSHMRTLLIMPAQQLLADYYNNCSISTMDVSMVIYGYTL